MTKDEISDPQNLDMWLDVNGKRMQTGNTKTMIFTVSQIISSTTFYIAQAMSFHRHPRVGMGMKPEPVYLEGT